MRERCDMKGMERDREIDRGREREISKKRYMDTVSRNNFARVSEY